MWGLPAPGPLRPLAAATLVNSFGGGLWTTSMALFLTRSVGLSVHQTGLALALTALISLVASTPVGYLSDRWGPREMLIGASIGLSVTMVAIGFADGLATFLCAAGPAAVCDAAARAAKGAVIGSVVPADRRVYTRAYLRSVTNVGIAAGAGLAGVGLAVDTPAAYLALVVGNAVTFLLAAAILTRLPRIAPVPAPTTGPRLVALRDRPFLAYVVLDGLMATHFGLFDVALPLWIAQRTDAPRWMIAMLLLVNTAMVVLLQVRAARGTETPAGGARAARKAGFALLLACAVYAGSGFSRHAVTIGLLLLGALLHVVGELWHSSAGWSISFGLAPADAHGQYQGAYAMGMQLGQILSPLLVTTLALGLGGPGWLLLGGGFALVGWLITPVVRWALLARPAVLAEVAAPAGTA